MASELKRIFRLISHHWITVGFILGFITDSLLLNRIDNVFDNLVLLFHVTLATVSLLLLYVGAAERVPVWLARPLTRFSPLAMQYSFGGLLSGMLIFYGRSGDWLASAPFLILILAIMIGNELVKKRSDRLVYHLALYFVGLFSYVVMVVPVATGKMGDGTFVLSGLFALLIVSFVVQVLYRIVPQFMVINTRRVIVTLGFIYVGLNTLYFTNIIPPIPLSLTELKIAQSVVSVSNESPLKSYRITYEEQPWYRGLPLMKAVVHPTGSSIACFARVYAPTKLEAKIYHRWEYKDASGRWQEKFRYGYPIAGTNKGGYGGYTVSEGVWSGVWRCSVETERGQVLGREVFVIDTSIKAQNVKTAIE